jgi:hypothetical protein
MWVDNYCYSQYQVASYIFSELIDKYVDIQTKYDLIDVMSFLKKKIATISSFTNSVDHDTPNTRD